MVLQVLVARRPFLLVFCDDETEWCLPETRSTVAISAFAQAAHNAGYGRGSGMLRVAVVDETFGDSLFVASGCWDHVDHVFVCF